MKTEWEAWIYLAMIWDLSAPRWHGLCSSLYNDLPYLGEVTGRMRDRMWMYKPKRFVGGFWWPLGENKPRIKFCWKMAEECEREEFNIAVVREWKKKAREW
jgi:hypothetical protein